MLIPKDVIFLLDTLEQAGYTAYIVGGPVRDMLMNRMPHDWDITTSAKPMKVKQLFKRTYDTGIEHGTVTVLLNHVHYEVTTYRIESDYKDCRHPENVQFVDDIEADLSRRDFTMNAIAYHPKRGYIDPYNGQEDIKNKVIRSVRCATERFSEDALRIIRAIRFSAQLNFSIEPETLKGIYACRSLLNYISKERLRDELNKILLSNQPSYIKWLDRLDLMPYILSKKIENLEYNLSFLNLATPILTVRLALLLQDSPAKSILKELKYDNLTIKHVTQLILYRNYFKEHPTTHVSIKKLLTAIDIEQFNALMSFRQAMGQDTQKEQALKEVVLQNQEPYKLSQLAISGADLVKAGIPQSKKIGTLLSNALEKVINEPNFNTKDQLIAYCIYCYNHLEN